MSESMNYINQIIDDENADKSAHTRRQMVAGAGAVIGGLGLAGLASGDAFAQGGKSTPNTVENITTIAATAEVLATIVNTVGYETVKLDDVTRQNIAAAAIEEKIHYEVLTSKAVGAKPATKRIWVPDEVFSSKENFLTTLVVRAEGDGPHARHRVADVGGDAVGAARRHVEVQQHHVRPTDTLARYGGEEFALLLPHCDTDTAEAIVGRLLEAVPGGQTASCGIAESDA